MNTTAALLQSEADQGSGLLRRAGRTLLGSAAILIVGAGGPIALPTGSGDCAARFVVGTDGKLRRAH